jgi:hypothetical protein
MSRTIRMCSAICAIYMCSAVGQRIEQRRMTIERRRDLYLDARMRGTRPVHQLGKVALQMRAESQKIGNDYNVADSALGEQGDGAAEIRPAAFQEPDFDGEVASAAGEFSGDRAYRVIGRCDTRSVGEHDIADL